MVSTFEKRTLLFISPDVQSGDVQSGEEKNKMKKGRDDQQSKLCSALLSL